MRVVSVTDLKARLSHYLSLVRRGTEIQVLHHGEPVARLIGMAATDIEDDSRKRRLIEAGILRAGRGDPLDALGRKPVVSPRADLSSALEDERGDRV